MRINCCFCAIKFLQHKYTYTLFIWSPSVISSIFLDDVATVYYQAVVVVDVGVVNGLAHHDGLELLVVDCTGSVLVDLINHLVNIGFRHRLVQSQQDLLQHLGVDRAFAFFVENSESLSDFFLFFSFFGLFGHQNQKLVKINESRTVTVNFLNALLKLVGLELMSQHSHDGPQFRGWNFTSSLFVDSLKRILEVGDEGVGQFVLRLFPSFVTHDDRLNGKYAKWDG